VRYDGDPNPYEEDLITGVFQIWDAHGGAQKAATAHSSAQVMVFPAALTLDAELCLLGDGPRPLTSDATCIGGNASHSHCSV
jgi:hypothetical protein